jgi:hypothetical protein
VSDHSEPTSSDISLLTYLALQPLRENDVKLLPNNLVRTNIENWKYWGHDAEAGRLGDMMVDNLSCSGSDVRRETRKKWKMMTDKAVYSSCDETETEIGSNVLDDARNYDVGGDSFV